MAKRKTVAKSKSKIVVSTPPDLTTMPADVLLKKAAAAWKAAVKDVGQAAKLLTAAVWKARQSGEYLLECERRQLHGGHGGWEEWLEKNYCGPYKISYRQAAKCLQIARPELKLLTAKLPPGATINQAASVAGKLNRGEQPPAPEDAPAPQPPDAELEVDEEGNLFIVAKQPSALTPPAPQPPGNADLLAFPQPPAPEEARAPTDEQRHAVRDYIQAALAEVKGKNTVVKIMAVLDKIGIDEAELVSRIVYGQR